MLLPALYYSAAAIGGWFVGDAVLQKVSGHSTVEVAAAVPTVIETGFPFSPFMLLSLAVVCVAASYAVRSIMVSLRSWNQNHHEDRYYH